MQVVDVSCGLGLAPGADRIFCDFFEIDFRTPGVLESCQGLSPLRGEIEFFSDAGEDIAFSDSAGVAFIDGGAEGGELGFVFAFVALQAAEGGADDFAGVFVAAGFDFFEDELVEFGGEVYVAGRHLF